MLDLLKAIPPEAYIALFTAIITATVTLLGVYLSNRANNQRLLLQLEHERDAKRERVLREKLEELYVLSDNWVNALFTDFLPYLKVMRGELTYNQALDLEITHGKGTRDFGRIEMLIDVYCPQVKDALDTLFQLRDRANDILACHRETYRSGQTDGMEFVEPLQRALDEIDKAAKALKARIRGQVKVT